MYNHLNDNTGLLPKVPTFATLNNGELDFILKSNYDNKVYLMASTCNTLTLRVNRCYAPRLTHLTFICGKKRYLKEDSFYGIEVKSGKNIGKTINKALELNKIDFAINAKGNTKGGFNEAERKYTISIQLFPKFKFDLGDKVVDERESLEKLANTLNLPIN